ncbi:MAG: ABC transporter substrate-binding protein, partial [Acidobacteriota bacterium]
TRGGEQPTGDGLITAAEAISNLDLGIGPRISFTPERHQATQRVWGTVLDATGSYRSLELSPAR